MSDANKEVFEFDKFMDEIVVKEEKKKMRDDDARANTPQREYAKRYRERTQNRIKYGR